MKLARKAGLINTGNIAVSYTGEMTDEIVTMSDGIYRLLTLTTSGVLTLSAPTKAEVCVIGGGCSGQNGKRGGIGTYAGGGAFMTTQIISRLTGGAGVIGAGGSRNSSVNTAFNAGGSTSFASLSSGSATSNNGGSGGGGSFPSRPPGTGDGLPKLPFGDSVHFVHPHCAGGGGGSAYIDSGTNSGYWSGGEGGTNGGNGLAGTKATSTTVTGGAGGDYGGGNGRHSFTSGESADATYYGGGGGGGHYDTGGSATPGGAGYQGIIYIRIPISIFSPT